jgi:hypothetical protein
MKITYLLPHFKPNGHYNCALLLTEPKKKLVEPVEEADPTSSVIFQNIPMKNIYPML